MTTESLAESFREAKSKAGHPSRIKYLKKLKDAAIEYFKANPSLTPSWMASKIGISTETYQQGAKRATEGLVIRLDHFQRALELVKPTRLRSYAIEFPKVSWDERGGYRELKERLRESLVLPLQYFRKFFSEALIKRTKGVMFWGPPDKGKTLLTKALASEAGANFISVSGPEIVSKWVGDSEKAICDIITRALAPCVLLFDELDTVMARRTEDSPTAATDNRLIGQLLTEIDGIQPEAQLLFVAATNRPESLD